MPNNSPTQVTAAPRGFWYHGSSRKNLRSILKQGLVPVVKKKNWHEDPDTSMYTPSRESFGGIYVTRNLRIARSAPQDKKQEGGVILIAMELQPNTFYLDEDRLLGGVNNAMGGLSRAENLVIRYYLAATNPQRHSWYSGKLEAKIEEYVQENLRRFDQDFVDRNIPWHPEMERRIRAVLRQTWLPALGRLAAHALKFRTRWDLSDDFRDTFGAEKGVVDWEPAVVAGDDAKLRTYFPSVEEAERSYREAATQITKTMRLLGRPNVNDQMGGMPDIATARVDEPIGYSGSNHIVAVGEYLWANDGPARVVMHYGEFPPDFFEQWKVMDGDMPAVTKAGDPVPELVTASTVTAAPRGIWYHGTYVKNLPSVLSEGLVPSGKDMNWGSDPQASAGRPSRESFGGIYFTRNLLTATGAIKDPYTEARVLLVIAELQPNSLILDEDDLVYALSHPLGSRSDSDTSVQAAWMGATIPELAPQWAESIQEYKQDFVAGALSCVKNKLTNYGANEKELHPRLLERITPLIEAAWLPAVTRIAAHLFTKPGKDPYYWRSGWRGQFSRAMIEAGDPPAPADVLPSPAEAEKLYKDAVEPLTRALRLLVVEEANTNRPTARIMTPVTYRGSNRIVCILEIREGLRYRRPGLKTPVDVIKHYGTIPQDFYAQWKTRQGSELNILSASDAQQREALEVTPEQAEEQNKPDTEQTKAAALAPKDWTPREDTIRCGFRAQPGAKRIGRDGYVDVLTEVPITDLQMPEGNVLYPGAIQKYKEQDSTEYPVVIPESGTMIVDDGNHRVEAARQKGAKSLLVWMRQPGFSKEREQDLTDWYANRPITYHASVEKRADHTNDEGFWAGAGNAASGILPICSSTKRICLAWRSSEVNQGDCFGTLGGAIQRGMSPEESAKEEMAEETGYRGGIQLHPAYVFTSKGGFRYFNFVGVVPTEFGFNPAGEHSWETDYIDWCTLEEIDETIANEPDSLHPGLIALFKNSRELIERLVAGGPDEPKGEKQASLTVRAYHGTRAGEFDAFKPHVRKGEQLGFGIHFAADKEFAASYAFNDEVARKGKAPVLYTVELTLNNPLKVDQVVEEGTPEFALGKKLNPKIYTAHTTEDKTSPLCLYLQNAVDATSPLRAQKLIQEAGYDGIVYDGKIISMASPSSYYTHAKGTCYIVFSPDQVCIVSKETEPEATSKTALNVENGYNISQDAQVDTPAFKAWFAGSKITDSHGRPLRVFHGTSADFDTFDPDKGARSSDQDMDNIPGVSWFGSNPAVGEYFMGWRDGGNVMPVYLSMKNPRIVDVSKPSDVGDGAFRVNGKTVYDIRYIKGREIQRAHDAGNDGVVFEHGYDGTPASGTIFAVFSPSQIKSAIGNNGEFNPEDHRITAKLAAFKSRLTDAQKDTLRQIEPRAGRPFKDWVSEQYGADDPDLQQVWVDEDLRLDCLYAWLSDEESIRVEDNGYIMFWQMNSTIERLIGDIPVMLYHHTSSLVLDKIKKEGLRPDTEKSNSYRNSHAGVYLTTEGSGAAVSGYHQNALHSHREQQERERRNHKGKLPKRLFEYGDAVTLLVKTRLKDLMPDPDDTDLESGKFQYVVPYVSPQDIIYPETPPGGPQSVKPSEPSKPTSILHPGLTRGEELHMSDLKPGDELSVDGADADVVSVTPEGTITIKELKTGEEGTWTAHDLRNCEVLVGRGNVVHKVKMAAQSITDTPAFKSWFSGSKVVDEHGAPLRCYHGTDGDFDVFGQGQDDCQYFTPAPEIASAYATDNNHNEDPRPNVMPVYLRIENPKVIGEVALSERLDDDEGVRDWIGMGHIVQEAREAGHDGIFLKEVHDHAGKFQDQWITFEPNQIKSAIGNNGDFDQKSDSITASLLKRKKATDSAHPNYLYHHTTVDNRASIQEHGLLSSRSYSYEMGGVGGTFFDSKASDPRPGIDVWKVDVRGLDIEPDETTDIENDPHWDGHSWWVLYEQDVPPERLTLVDSGERKQAGAEQSPAFKRWFSGSKVVDDQGNPLVVYHGTKHDFESFLPNRLLFFTADKSYAHGFIDPEATGGRMIPAYLSLKNPLDARQFKDLSNREYGDLVGLSTKWMIEEYGRQSYPFWYWFMLEPRSREGLIKKGYDGVIQEEQEMGGPARCISYAAFYPNQVKSALGNKGEFNTEDIRITASTPNPFDPVIAVDLDDTLAVDIQHGAESFDPLLIGPPIPDMVRKIKAAISNGYEVIVFTARMYDKEHAAAIEKAIGDWTEEHIGTRLKATNEKTPGMVLMLDDKARQVIDGEVVTKQAFINQDIVWLKQHLTLSDRDKGEEIARQIPGYFKEYVEGQDEGLANKLWPDPDNDDDWLEDYSQVPDHILCYFLEDGGQWMQKHDPADAPSFLHMEYMGIVKNQWLVHKTDDPDGICSSGFTIGMDDLARLGLTNCFNDSDKRGGYNFAFLPGPAGGNKSYVMENRYGSDAVIFRASGLKVYHYGDEETQVIFRGSEAHDLIPVYKREGEWCLPEDDHGKPVFKADTLTAVFMWVEANYAQYHKTIVKKATSLWKKADRLPPRLYHGTSMSGIVGILKDNAMSEGCYWDRPNEPHGIRLTKSRQVAETFAHEGLGGDEGAVIAFDTADLAREYNLVEYRDVDCTGEHWQVDEQEVVVEGEEVAPIRPLITAIYLKNPYTTTEALNEYAGLVEGEGRMPAKAFLRGYKALMKDPLVKNKPAVKNTKKADTSSTASPALFHWGGTAKAGTLSLTDLEKVDSRSAEIIMSYMTSVHYFHLPADSIDKNKRVYVRWVNPNDFWGEWTGGKKDPRGDQHYSEILSAMKDGKVFGPAVTYGREYVDGNTRAYAAKELGVKSIPTIRVEDFIPGFDTEEDARRRTELEQKRKVKLDAEMEALYAELGELGEEAEGKTAGTDKTPPSSIDTTYPEGSNGWVNFPDKQEGALQTVPLDKLVPDAKKSKLLIHKADWNGGEKHTPVPAQVAEPLGGEGID